MIEIPELTNRKFLVTNLFWWGFWAAFQSYILVDSGFNLETSIADGVFLNALLALASYAIGHMVRYYLPSLTNRYYLFASGIVLAGLSVYIEKEALVYFFASDKIYMSFLEKTLLLRFAVALLMIEFRILTSWIWYYLKETQEEESRKKDMENMVREAELSKLRQELQPHFLFNSLNSISALVGSRPGEARKMIQELSDFLRGTLKKDDKQTVSLEEELNHLNLYLEIEKVRFGHRLTTIISKSENSEKGMLPPLLLQPIVENAIKFGLYDTIGEITIRIESFYEKNLLVIRVENPFDPTTSNIKPGTGFGLNSVKRRLYLLYARYDLLSTTQEDNLFTTTIKIPQRND